MVFAYCPPSPGKCAKREPGEPGRTSSAKAVGCERCVFLIPRLWGYVHIITLVGRGWELLAPCTSSSSKSRAELAAASSESNIHSLSSFYRFIRGLSDFMNMSLIVIQAMKKLFQFCSREYKCAFLEVASFGIASRLAMGLPHFIGEVLGTANAIVHRFRHTSRALWTFSSPLVPGAIYPFLSLSRARAGTG